MAFFIYCDEFSRKVGKSLGPVVFVTGDTVSEKMAGAAVRCTELSRIVATKHQVSVTSLNNKSTRNTTASWFFYPSGSAARTRVLAKSRVIVLQGFSSREIPQSIITSKTHFIVIDLYCPYWLENSAKSSSSASIDVHQHRLDISILRDQLRFGDFFCAHRNGSAI